MAQEPLGEREDYERIGDTEEITALILMGMVQ